MSDLTVQWDTRAKTLVCMGGHIAHCDRCDRGAIPEFELNLSQAGDIRVEHLLWALQNAAVDPSFTSFYDVPFAVLYILYHAPTLAAWSSNDSPTAIDIFTLTPNLDQLDIEVEVELMSGITTEALLQRIQPILEVFHFAVREIEQQFTDTGSKVAILHLDVDPDITISEIAKMAQSSRCVGQGFAFEFADLIARYQAVRASGGSVLLGQAEVGFDAKRDLYNLNSEKNKFDLAADIAAFANSESSGLIIIGAITERDSLGRDIVKRVVGCTDDRNLNLGRLRDVTDARIFPLVSDLRFEVVPTMNDRYLVVILIPAQSDSLQPFLIRGAYLDSSTVIGSAFSIPIRRADGNRTMTAEYVHSLIMLGKSVNRHR
ncbi:MAG: hypothetical protein WCF33_10225 [Pseudonocardiaceae bacterium]